MSPKRKLVAALAIFLIAGGATGAALAASSHSSSTTTPRLVQGKSLLAASAAYLGTTLPALKSELHPGHPLAAIASATPGRSVAGLQAALYHDALARLGKGKVARTRAAFVHAWLHKRIAGYVAGTCPLSLGKRFLRLGGTCPGMMM